MMPELEIECGPCFAEREESAFDGRSVEEILTFVALGHSLKNSASSLAVLANDVLASALRDEIERSHTDHLRESGFLTPENDGCKTPEPHKMVPPPVLRPARRVRGVMRPLPSSTALCVDASSARRGPLPSFSFGTVPRSFSSPGSRAEGSIWTPVPRRGGPDVKLLDAFFAPAEPAAKRAKIFA